MVRPSSLSIVLFRRLGWDAEHYNRWSQNLLARQIAFVTPTKWEGETVGRIAFLHPNTTDEMVRQVDSALVQLGICHPGDLVIVVAGTPPTTPGATNTIRVHHIGDVVQRDR